MFKVTTKELTLSALFTALIAVGAFIKIPIGPIPITFQLFFTILAGFVLGPKLGIISVLTYIFIGLIGIPVFTGGGGIGYVLSPTFGYIIGFLFCAFIAGYVMHKSKYKSLKAYIIAALLGIIVVYVFGLTHFYLIQTLYLGKDVAIKGLLFNCFIIFIPSDLVNATLAILVAKRLNKVTK